MVNVSKKPCEVEDCNKSAHYKMKREKKIRFCTVHKVDGMVRVVSKHRACRRRGCGTTASFNFKGKKTGLLCSRHKKDGMVLVSSKCCEHSDCVKRALFNIPGGNGPRFCGEHQLTGMVNFQRRGRCEIDGCSSEPHFNFEGEKGLRFCAEHKLEGMVTVQNKQKRECELEGCRKAPSFGFLQQKGRFCGKHRLEGMVNLVSARTCEHEQGCTKRPNFNHEGEKRGRFCAQHKLNGMVELIAPRRYHQPKHEEVDDEEVKLMVMKVVLEGQGQCGQPECTTKPSFSYEGEKNGIFCRKHKKKGMVNVRRTSSKEHLTAPAGVTQRGRELKQHCKHLDGCVNFAVFDFDDNGTGSFCRKHKLEGMVNVRSKSKTAAKKITAEKAKLTTFLI